MDNPHSVSYDAFKQQLIGTCAQRNDKQLRVRGVSGIKCSWVIIVQELSSFAFTRAYASHYARTFTGLGSVYCTVIITKISRVVMILVAVAHNFLLFQGLAKLYTLLCVVALFSNEHGKNKTILVVSAAISNFIL